MTDISQDIKDIIIKDQEYSISDTLRVSGIGEQCARRVWYNYHDPLAAKKSITALLAAEDGRRGEELMLDRLLLLTDIEFLESQVEITLLDGQLIGHCDGILLYKGEEILWEHKNKEQKFYNRLTKLGNIQAWDSQYYDQVQLYMYGLELERCLFTVATPGGRDFQHHWVEFNAPYAELLLEKGTAIIESKEPFPRVSENAEYWLCKCCQYFERCHTTTEDAIAARKKAEQEHGYHPNHGIAT